MIIADERNLCRAFIAGLNDGIDTYDLGLSLSQIVYFSPTNENQNSVMITASHNPKVQRHEFDGYSETMVPVNPNTS